MKKHVTARLLAFCILMIAVITCGCSQKTVSEEGSTREASTSFGTQDETAGETVAETEEAEETIDEETMDFIKYNIYVEMNNYMIRVLDNIYNYYMVVDFSDEFTLIPDSGYSYKYGISSLNSSIIDDALTVAYMAPAFEGLDELTIEIAEPMRTLMDTFSDISSCYDFADNQYAKAREFHAVIQENAGVFAELAYEFLDEINELSSERVLVEEQRMLDEGLLIAYNASHMITVAEQIVNECYTQGVHDANIIELDLTNIRPLYEELTATVEAFKEATGDNNQLVMESLSNSTPMYGLPDSLVQSVEWMIRQVESQVPIEDPGREYLGGIVHIEEVLSDCINQYNSVFAE